MDRVKRNWYLSPMRAAKVQASLRIRAVSPEPPLLAHTSSESRGTFRRKARSLAPLNGWACAVKICHAGMLEDTNSLDGAQIMFQNECTTSCNLPYRILFTFYLDLYWVSNYCFLIGCDEMSSTSLQYTLLHLTLGFQISSLFPSHLGCQNKSQFTAMFVTT